LDNFPELLLFAEHASASKSMAGLHLSSGSEGIFLFGLLCILPDFFSTGMIMIVFAKILDKIPN